MNVVLLAAGEGTRLRPFTLRRPKPLFPILGVPLISRLLNQLAKEGINEFTVVVSYRADQLISYLQEAHPQFTFHIVHQGKPQGTGHAALVGIQHALQHSQSSTNEWTLLLNADILVSDDAISTAISHLKQEVPLLTAIEVSDPTQYGIFEIAPKRTSSTGLPIVSNLLEKPSIDQAPTRLANAGIYVLSPSFLTRLKNLRPSKRNELELTDALKEAMEDGEEFALYTISDDGYWFDLGLPWHILEANARLLELEPETREGTVEDGAHLFGKVIIKKGARIRSGAYLEGPIFIDENADIGPNCYIRGATYLGPSTRIGNACEVKNSVILRNTHAGHLSYIGDSVLDENVNFGAGTITANLRLDKQPVPMVINDKKLSSGRRKLGAFVGKGVQTGIGATIMPGIRIDPDTYIGSNSLIMKNIPEGSVAYTPDPTVVKPRSFRHTPRQSS